MKDIKKGDLVAVTFDAPGDVGITDEMKQFEGGIYKVSKVRYSPTRMTRFAYTYELDGCVSSKGVPFTFTRDWIAPIREVNYEP